MKAVPIRYVWALLMIPAEVGATEYGTPSVAGGLAQMVGALALVVGLILVLYYLAGRIMKVSQRGFSYIRVVETKHLGPKKALMLVDVGGEYLLLANTGDNITFLKHVEMLEEIEVVSEVESVSVAGIKKRVTAHLGGFF